MRMISLFTVAGCCLTPSAPLHAQAAADDVRCFVVSNLFARAASDVSARAAATGAGYYYLGRIDQFPKAKLRTLFLAAQRSITKANAASTMIACGERMNRSGKAMQALAQELAKARTK